MRHDVMQALTETSTSPQLQRTVHDISLYMNITARKVVEDKPLGIDAAHGHKAP